MPSIKRCLNIILLSAAFLSGCASTNTAQTNLALGTGAGALLGAAIGGRDGAAAGAAIGAMGAWGLERGRQLIRCDEQMARMGLPGTADPQYCGPYGYTGPARPVYPAYPAYPTYPAYQTQPAWRAVPPVQRPLTRPLPPPIYPARRF